MAVEVASLLFDVEVTLKRLNLWQQQPPPGSALMSRQPFSIDTLTFPQWLQFVFLPSMHGLIKDGRLLPDSCQIEPMAQEYFKPLGLDADSLINTIRCLDQHLSRR